MFYYYGAKNLLSRYYPEPRYDTIIEPFAGSAAYSCFHLLKNKNLKALLCDKDDDVAETWDFLLKCSERDILNYKTPTIGEHAYEFLIKTCTVSNASSKCKKMKYTERLDRVFQIQKRRILKFLPIRDRITFIHGDYSNIKNLENTWFIDPPYQITDKNGSVFQNGDGYSKKCNVSNIEFEKLGDWCRGRNGQVIVCEKEGANWLPFEKFRTNKTSLNKNYNEVIYTNDIP
jgi:site-specific DNA-adenine methylase